MRYLRVMELTANGKQRLHRGREAPERQPNFMASSLLTLPASSSIYNPARNSSGRFGPGDFDCVFPSSALGSSSSSSSSSSRTTTRSLLQKHWDGGGGGAPGYHNGFSGIGISFFLRNDLPICLFFVPCLLDAPFGETVKP